MVCSMTAGLALYTCREPLYLTITTNLKNAFMGTVRVSRVKSVKFGHQVNSDTFANSVNPDETAPYEPSHQDFQCLLF